MKNPFFVLIFLVAYSYAIADVDTCTTLEMTITFKNGNKQRVYFPCNLIVQKDDRGYFYCDRTSVMRLHSKITNPHSIDIAPIDYHFSTFARRLMSDDSVYVNDDAVLIQFSEGDYQVPLLAYVNKTRKISTKEISDIVVHRAYMIPCGGIGVETRIKPEDLKWLAGAKVLHVGDAGGFEMCNYQALYYSENKKQVMPHIKKLIELYSQQSSQPGIDQTLILQEIERVKEKLLIEHVLIIGSCYC